MNKKWIALLLALVLALGAMTACGQSETESETEQTDDTTITESTTDGADADEGEEPVAEPSDEEAPEAPVDEDEGEEPVAEEPVAEADSSSLEGVIDAIYAVEDPILGSLVTMPVDLDDADTLAYYTGLSDGSKLVEAAVSEPMIGSQAYSLVVVRVADEADAEDVAREIMANIDTAKWICVSADDTAAAVSGDLVLFVMIDEYNDDLSASAFVDAFLSIYGGSVVE